MKKRTVRRNRKNYRPGYGIHVCSRRDKGFTLKGYFTEWYDPMQLPERDRKDWLKLGGVSYFDPFNWRTWEKNKAAALGAFRMGEEENTFEITGYTNMKDGSFHDGENPVLLGLEEEFEIDYDPFNGLATFEIKVDSRDIYQQEALPIDLLSYQMSAGAWHGGNPPAPVKHSIRTSIEFK